VLGPSFSIPLFQHQEVPARNTASGIRIACPIVREAWQANILKPLAPWLAGAAFHTFTSLPVEEKKRLAGRNPPAKGSNFGASGERGPCYDRRIFQSTPFLVLVDDEKISFLFLEGRGRASACFLAEEGLASYGLKVDCAATRKKTGHEPESQQPKYDVFFCDLKLSGIRPQRRRLIIMVSPPTPELKIRHVPPTQPEGPYSCFRRVDVRRQTGISLQAPRRLRGLSGVSERTAISGTEISVHPPLQSTRQ